ncbi:hypothetical protein V6N11_018612 [Hibiscus sabdariffa]|uniref:RNase H type-1 domain-containing protein n=1 Tax=Hibiscus sabdariffa TaxID=183260 RepID=A0ABR2N8E1_9ROSI
MTLDSIRSGPLSPLRHFFMTTFLHPMTRRRGRCLDCGAGIGIVARDSTGSVLWRLTQHSVGLAFPDLAEDCGAGIGIVARDSTGSVLWRLTQHSVGLAFPDLAEVDAVLLGIQLACGRV